MPTVVLGGREFGLRGLRRGGGGVRAVGLGTSAGRNGGSGTLGSCDGAFAVDLNALWCPTCPKAATNPGESAAVQAQFWYRDPLSTSGEPTALSDAVQVWLGP